MEELIAQLTTIARGMWRFRWPALAVAWIVGIAGVVILFRVPDRYEASARIYVDTQSILKPLMQGLAVQPNVDQQVVMLSRTLISRPTMEKLVRMADLDLKADSKRDQDDLITGLMSDVQIKTTGRDNLYVLSYRHTEPAKAQKVVQSLVSIFIESSLGSTRKDAETARNFLNEQIKAYEAKLDEAEAKLKEFKIRNIDVQIAEGSLDSSARLSQIAEQLNQAKLALREAEQSRDAVRQQLQTPAPPMQMPTAPGMPEVPLASAETAEIDARIGAQKRNLDALLQRYTEQHPDVTYARRLIRDLEAQKQKEVQELQRAAAEAAAAAASAASGASIAAGPATGMVAQEMSRMMATTEVQLAAMRARVAELQNRYNVARDSLRTAPALEAEAAQLNRDYQIHKNNYNSLVARRESAAMSGELEVASGVADFRLIDPPRVAPNPVAPNRLALLPLVFAVALGAGIFTAFAGSQLRPVFHSAGELRNKVNIPLLGVVSRLRGAAELRRERASLVRFMVGSGGLVGTFIFVFVALTIIASRRVG